jgi:hypothetical protein
MMNGTRRTFQFLVATVALTLILGGLATTGEVAATEATGWQDFSAACVGDGGIPTIGFDAAGTVIVACAFPNGDTMICDYQPDGGGHCAYLRLPLEGNHTFEQAGDRCIVLMSTAADFGEGYRTLPWWKERLSAKYAREYAARGWAFGETMPLVCKRFQVVFHCPAVSRPAKSRNPQLAIATKHAAP